MCPIVVLIQMFLAETALWNTFILPLSPSSPYPSLWNFVCKFCSGLQTPCLSFPLTFMLYWVTNGVTCGEKSSWCCPHRLPVQTWKERAPFRLWSCKGTSVLRRFQLQRSSSQSSLSDSAAHLWFINWWFMTQRHIGSANMSALLFLLFPDVRRRGFVVQVHLGFVNQSAVSVKVRLSI